MTPNEALARRWMASKHWGGWRVGMVARDGGVAVQVSSTSLRLSYSDARDVWTCEWFDQAEALPDLDHPGTRAFLLEDVRRALGFLASCPFSDDGGRTWHLWRGRQCFSGGTEAEALIAALEAAPE